MDNYIDYKDVETLKKFLTPQGRIQAKKRSASPAKEQRQIALAMKTARYVGLLPYISR